MSLLRGRRYNRTKKTKAEAGAKGGLSKDQNDTCLQDNTAERLAKQHGVSKATIEQRLQKDFPKIWKQYVPIALCDDRPKLKDLLVKHRPKRGKGRPPKEDQENHSNRMNNEPARKPGTSRLYIEERLQRDHPSWSQQQIADAVGCSQQYVARVVTTEKSQCNKSVVPPSHIKTRPHQADFRKLPPELQQQVAAIAITPPTQKTTDDVCA